MTPEFAESLVHIRLSQTAELLAWMVANHPEPAALVRAHDAVTEALQLIEMRGSSRPVA